MSSYENTENEFGEGIAAFEAMPKTRQIAQPKDFKDKYKNERGPTKFQNSMRPNVFDLFL